MSEKKVFQPGEEIKWETNCCLLLLLGEEKRKGRRSTESLQFDTNQNRLNIPVSLISNLGTARDVPLRKPELTKLAKVPEKGCKLIELTKTQVKRIKNITKQRKKKKANVALFKPSASS